MPLYVYDALLYVWQAVRTRLNNSYIRQGSNDRSGPFGSGQMYHNPSPGNWARLSTPQIHACSWENPLPRPSESGKLCILIRKFKSKRLKLIDMGFEPRTRSPDIPIHFFHGTVRCSRSARVVQLQWARYFRFPFLQSSIQNRDFAN